MTPLNDYGVAVELKASAKMYNLFTLMHDLQNGGCEFGSFSKKKNIYQICIQINYRINYNTLIGKQNEILTMT